jgi:AraC family transcriptional regulator of adaptative response / DNA-3-methyladenine glycosylase II
MRVPTTVDPWETLLRAVVGQQVSVAGATTVLGRLVMAVHCEQGEQGEQFELGEQLRAFPTAHEVAALNVSQIAACGMPSARAATISTLAQRVAGGVLDLRGGDSDAIATELLAIRGIGPWTVDYFRMRGLADPDAFPATDLILKQNAQRIGLGKAPRELVSRSAHWRPWRAYAAHHLWNLPKETM